MRFFLGLHQSDQRLFRGQCPGTDTTVFSGDAKVTVYYYSGTTGWSSTFAGVPAVEEVSSPFTYNDQWRWLDQPHGLHGLRRRGDHPRDDQRRGRNEHRSRGIFQ